MQKPINYSKAFSNEDIQKKCDELIDDFKSFEQIDLEKNSTLSFVKHLFLRLSYRLLKMLKFYDGKASQIGIKENQKKRNKLHLNKFICNPGLETAPMKFKDF